MAEPPEEYRPHVRPHLYRALKRAAYKEDRTMPDVVNSAVEGYLKDRERRATPSDKHVLELVPTIWKAPGRAGAMTTDRDEAQVFESGALARMALGRLRHWPAATHRPADPVDDFECQRGKKGAAKIAEILTRAILTREDRAALAESVAAVRQRRIPDDRGHLSRLLAFVEQFVDEDIPIGIGPGVELPPIASEDCPDGYEPPPEGAQEVGS